MPATGRLVLVFIFYVLTGGVVLADGDDDSLFPNALAVLSTDRFLYPVEMGDWPAKIDSKHQLFIDDYLVQSTSGLSREYHKLRRHPANPLWTPPKRMAQLYFVVRDEQDRFRLWYMQRVQAVNEDGHTRRHPTGYLESDDGIQWRAPKLGVVTADGNTDNNYVFWKSLDGIFYEPREPHPSRRYKALAHLEPDNDKTSEVMEGYWLYVSPDGIHWTRGRRELVAKSLFSGYGLPQGGIGDTSSFRWDPGLGKYICSAKFVFPGKYRAYGICESDDLIHWTRPRTMFYRDSLDPEGMQFYAHHTFHYESMWFGLIKTMQIFSPEGKHWKHCELQLSLSRDGRHFTRCPDRSPILPIPENGLDMDYPSVAPGSPIRMGHELWFYYSDRRHGNRPGPRPASEKQVVDMRLFLATLRLDGFASLNAGEQPGRVVTRPLTFTGKSLFINADIGAGGYVRAELRKAFSETGEYVPLARRKPWGETIEPYALATCNPVRGNVYEGKITWAGRDMLERPAGTSPRLVFELKNAKLYSFWIE